jgi:hygromycin-B 4-O-kinase
MSIEPAQVARFLAGRCDAERVTRVGAGAWSTAFSFEQAGRRKVVRFGRHAEDFRKDERAAVLYGSVLRVPRVLEIGDAFGGYAYAISEWAAGVNIDRLREREMRRVLPSLLDTLVALRTAPPPSEAGFGWWPSRGRALHDSWRRALLGIAEDAESPRMRGWHAFLRDHAEGAALFDRAAARLAEVAAACPDGVRHLIHGDLLAGNVLCVDGAVSAVIDWGNALVGDFLYDVAWLVFWSPWHPGLDPERVLAEFRRSAEESGADLRNADERLLACQLHTALESMAYNAFRRDEAKLAGTMGRLAPLLDDPRRR